LIGKIKSVNFVLLIVSLVVSLLVAELILHIIFAPHKISSGWLWHDSPLRNLSIYKNDMPNELGFRGQPIKYEKDDYVVVLLGDSQAEAATSPLEKMPERLLQKYLTEQIGRSVKVFTLGAAGYGQDQELIALEKYYKKYRADLVLVWATPVNDFWENAFPDRRIRWFAGHIKPTYKLVNNVLQGPYFESDFIHDKYDYSELLHLVMMSVPKLGIGPIEQNILKEWLKDLPPPHDKIPNESCNNLQQIGEKEYDILKIKPKGKYILITREDFIDSRSHFSPFAVNRSPRDNYLVNITRKLYERINETADKNHSQFRVFFPDRYEFDRSSLEPVECIQYGSDRSTAIPIKMDQVSLLKEIISPDKLIVFDLQGGMELSFSETNPHLSDIGNERVMRNLAPLLVKHTKFYGDQQKVK
jgi:hypothetical protein